MHDKGGVQKIVAIICFVGLTASVLLAHNSPATGYELSIYDSTPLLYWVFLIIGISGGIGIVIFQIITRGYTKSNFWLTGLALVLYARVSLLLMPYVRGYVSWQSDNISHLGLVKDILFDGAVASTNYYPFTHIILSQTIIITDLESRIFLNVSTTFISLLFVLFTYLLATAVFPNRGQHILATLLAGSILVGEGYNVFLMPNGWSIFLLPLLFYCYFKREKISFNILFILLLIIYPFLHPLSALLIILSLILLEILKFIHSRLMSKKSSKDTAELKNSFTPIMISLVCFLPWVLSFRAFNRNLDIIWQQITTGIGPDTIGGIGSKLDKVQVGGFDLIVLAIKMYGVPIILGAISFIGLIIILKRQVADGGLHNRLKILQLYTIFTCFSLLYFLYLIGFPGSGAIAGGRIINYFVILTPCLSAYALFVILNRKQVHKEFPAIYCAALIVAVSILSINILYPSPYEIRPNPQITQMDMVGMSWYINEKDPSIESSYIMSPPFRFADGLLGSVEADGRSDLRKWIRQVPDHFDLANDVDTNETNGHNWSTSTYIAITEFDRVIYSTVWKDVGRFDDEDFDRLEWSMSAEKLYSNSGTDVFFGRIVT